MEAEALGALGGFELIERVAVGGMASLYLARRAGARGFVKPVAVKVVHPHLADDEEFLEMFVDEANLCSRLSHPNVVHVEELGEDRGFLYLVMEFVDGCALRALLRQARKREAPLALPVAVHIVAKAAEGLHYAHELGDDDGQPLGLVHRDVSPTNLLLSRSGHVKVIDFGVAKSTQQVHQTSTRKLKGKVAYMSPEQVRYGPIDRRSDIYSLGVVLWEMLANQRAFRGKDELQLIREVTSKPLPPISAVRDDLPEDLVRALRQATRRDPDKRFSTVEAFRRALLAAIPEAIDVRGADIAAVVRDATMTSAEEVSVHRRVKKHGSRASSSSSWASSGATPSSWVGAPSAVGPSVEAPVATDLPPRASTRDSRASRGADLTSDLALRSSGSPMKPDGGSADRVALGLRAPTRAPVDPGAPEDEDSPPREETGGDRARGPATVLFPPGDVELSVALGQRAWRRWAAGAVVLLMTMLAVGWGLHERALLWGGAAEGTARRGATMPAKPGGPRSDPAEAAPASGRDDARAARGSERERELERPAATRADGADALQGSAGGSDPPREPEASADETLEKAASDAEKASSLRDARRRRARARRARARRRRAARARRDRERAARAVSTPSPKKPAEPSEPVLEVDGLRLAAPEDLDRSTLRTPEAPSEAAVVEQDDVKLADEYQ